MKTRKKRWNWPKKTSWPDSLLSLGLKLNCMTVVPTWFNWLVQSKGNSDNYKKKLKDEIEKKKSKLQKKEGEMKGKKKQLDWKKKKKKKSSFIIHINNGAP